MFAFALRNLLSRPLRSALALCGLTVAIAGMVGLFSVAEGIQDTVQSTFGKMPGLVIIQPGAPIPLFSRLPSDWDAELSAIEGVHVVHPEVWARAHLVNGKAAISPPRFLFGSDLARADRLLYSIYREKMTAGRYLTADDRGTLHCVISKAIAEEQHRAVGDTLKVDGKDLEIVGIYDTKSLFLDVAIIIDITLAREMGKVGEDTVCNFYVEPQAAVRYSDIADRINALLANRGPGAWQPTLDQALDLAGDNAAVKQLAPLAKAALAAAGEANAPKPSPGDAPIEIRSPEDWSDQVQQFTADLDLFLAIMTTIGIT
ncbi:MAG TPA: ABC transporter permease, partial [Planctomycetaceae bacterium]|nr:ABC transporter permease [Planctomycetaceae bacterium]